MNPRQIVFAALFAPLALAVGCSKAKREGEWSDSLPNLSQLIVSDLDRIVFTYECTFHDSVFITLLRSSHDRNAVYLSTVIVSRVTGKQKRTGPTNIDPRVFIECEAEIGRPELFEQSLRDSEREVLDGAELTISGWKGHLAFTHKRQDMQGKLFDMALRIAEIAGVPLQNLSEGIRPAQPGATDNLGGA